VPELPESVPKGPFLAACGLALVGFIAILFARGNELVLLAAMVLVLAGGAIGLKLGLDWWKATE